MKLRLRKKAYQRKFKMTLAWRRYSSIAQKSVQIIADALLQCLTPQPAFKALASDVASELYNIAGSCIILPNRGPTLHGEWWE